MAEAERRVADVNTPVRGVLFVRASRCVRWICAVVENAYCERICVPHSKLEILNPFFH